MPVSALSVGPRYMQDGELLAGSVCGQNCEAVLGMPAAQDVSSHSGRSQRIV